MLGIPILQGVRQQRCDDDFLGLHLRVASISEIEQIKAAFPPNDLGFTDFDGHRGYHFLQDYRRAGHGRVQAVTKKIVLGVIGLCLRCWALSLVPCCGGCNE